MNGAGAGGNVLGIFQLPLKKFIKSRHRYRRCYVRWRDNRRANIAMIRELYVGLEWHRHNCNITSLSASLAGAVGGVLTGVGLILIPFSFGATTPLVISGTVVLVSAGATGLGGAAADILISRSKCKTAQEIINRDIELTTELQLLEQEYSRALANLNVSLIYLRTNHPREYNQLQQYVVNGSSCVFGAYRAGSCFYRMVRLARTAHLASLLNLPVNALELIDNLNPIPWMSIGSKVDDVLEAGGRAGVAATRGARVGLIATGVLCAVGLVLDVTAVVYSSIQIDKHRKNQQDGVNPDESTLPLVEEETEILSFGKKLKRKLKRTFKKDKYISEQAERLKSYKAVLETELMEMETTENIQELAVMCRCQNCTPIGGGIGVRCCHDNEFNWTSVQSRTDTPFLMYNAATLCVTQHPAFTRIYLNEESLQQHFPHLKNLSSSGKFHARHRILRFSAYILYLRNTSEAVHLWTTTTARADMDRRVPDCVHAAVVHAFPPDIVDVWASGSQDLGINTLWRDMP